MIQKMSDHKMEVKILDFGRACTTDSVYVGNGMESDFLNALRIFSALYFGEEFKNLIDLKKNWRTKVTIRVCTILNGHNLTTEWRGGGFLLRNLHSLWVHCVFAGGKLKLTQHLF